MHQAGGHLNGDWLLVPVPLPARRAIVSAGHQWKDRRDEAMLLQLPFPLQDNTLKSLAGTAAAFQICIDVSLMGQVSRQREAWEKDQAEK